jgi:preprotein translocase subunit YajC
MPSNQTFTLIYFAAIIALFYFLFIRPQQKRQREAVALMAALGVGDKVITASGLYGTLTSVGDETVEIQVADGVIVTMAKAAVVKKIEG